LKRMRCVAFLAFLLCLNVIVVASISLTLNLSLDALVLSYRRYGGDPLPTPFNLKPNGDPLPTPFGPPKPP